MFIVVAYDISDDKRRTRVMKMLRGYGQHVQESVFECHLEGPVYRQMLERLTKLIEKSQDNVRLYHLCNDDIGRIRQLGIGRPVQLSREFGIL